MVRKNRSVNFVSTVASLSLIVSLSILAANFVSAEDEVVVESVVTVNVCHKDGESGNWTALSIPEAAVAAHVPGHDGDYLATELGVDETFDSEWCATHAPTPEDPGDNDPETATIHATKIICDSEDDLPNWGEGDSDITASTVLLFLAADLAKDLKQDCQVTEWNFQWAPDGTTNPGDNVESASSPWTTFSGTATVPAGALVWVREEIPSNYVQFNGDTEAPYDNDVSAELYCHTDVLNYDNFDWIDPVEAGETYYCVGFNVLKTPETSDCPEGQHLNNDQQCVPDDPGGQIDCPLKAESNYWDFVDINGDPSSEGDPQVAYANTHTISTPGLGSVKFTATLQDTWAGNPVTGSPMITFRWYDPEAVPDDEKGVGICRNTDNPDDGPGPCYTGGEIGEGHPVYGPETDEIILDLTGLNSDRELLSVRLSSLQEGENYKLSFCTDEDESSCGADVTGTAGVDPIIDVPAPAGTKFVHLKPGALGGTGGNDYVVAGITTTCDEGIDNTCVFPEPASEGDKIIVIGQGGGEGEETLQQILTEQAYPIDVTTDETGYQKWNVPAGTTSVTINAKLVGHGAEYNNTFGYITNDNPLSFTPIFAVPPGYDNPPAPLSTGPIVINTTGVTTLAFAIKTTETGLLHSTVKSMNSGSEDHAVVYNSSSNKYIIGFEDVAPLADSDVDYQDALVEVNIVDCDHDGGGEPTTVKVTIVKYLNGTAATAASANSAAFPVV